MSRQVILVLGTRPELITLAPIIGVPVVLPRIPAPRDASTSSACSTAWRRCGSPNFSTTRLPRPGAFRNPAHQ
ncbi:MAG: hypothetical protein ABIZ05_10945 [Pseudonocardiaceae bacterium]